MQQRDAAHNTHLEVAVVSALARGPDDLAQRAQPRVRHVHEQLKVGDVLCGGVRFARCRELSEVSACASSTQSRSGPEFQYLLNPRMHTYTIAQANPAASHARHVHTRAQAWHTHAHTDTFSCFFLPKDVPLSRAGPGRPAHGGACPRSAPPEWDRTRTRSSGRCSDPVPAQIDWRSSGVDWIDARRATKRFSPR